METITWTLAVVIGFLTYLFYSSYSEVSNIEPITYGVCMNEYDNNVSKCTHFSDEFMNELGLKENLVIKSMLNDSLDSQIDMALSKSFFKSGISLNEDKVELARTIKIKLYYMFPNSIIRPKNKHVGKIDMNQTFIPVKKSLFE